MVLKYTVIAVIARSKATKQSKMRDCFTEFTLNEMNVFAMTIHYCGNPVASYREFSS